MEKILASLISKLQALKSLPNSEYRAVGEHLLPLAIEAKDGISQMELDIKKDYEDKWLSMVGRAANGEVQQIFVGKKTYTVTVTVS